MRDERPCASKESGFFMSTNPHMKAYRSPGRERRTAVSSVGLIF